MHLLWRYSRNVSYVFHLVYLICILRLDHLYSPKILYLATFVVGYLFLKISQNPNSNSRENSAIAASGSFKNSYTSSKWRLFFLCSFIPFISFQSLRQNWQYSLSDLERFSNVIYYNILEKTDEIRYATGTIIAVLIFSFSICVVIEFEIVDKTELASLWTYHKNFVSFLRSFLWYLY